MFLVIVISAVFILFYLKITIFIPPLSAIKLAPKVTHKADNKASPTFAPKVPLEVYPKVSPKAAPKVLTKDAPKVDFNVSPKFFLIVAP